MRNIVTTILLSLSFLCFSQEKQAEVPRLVVGIKIDGLQADHLQKMWKYFTPGGFRKIVSEGASLEGMRHSIISAGNAVDAATFMTGTFPFYHGVSSDYYFNKADNQVVSILFDKNYTGIGTRDKFSAHRLLCTTFTDELILSNPLSQVHSIGVDAENAVMLGGHAATSVSWMDDATYRWTTTAYYPKGLSRWADLINVDGTFKRLSEEKWIPSASISTYMNPTSNGSKSVGFSYNPMEKQGGTALLRNTPAANSLVTELARSIVDKEQLGMDKNPDVLMLQYTLKAPNQITSSLKTAEQEDLYIRLDRNLQTLLSVLTAKVGADKLLVFMVGSGSDAHSPVELGKNQIPAGFFNADRAMALLNSYLMVIYGQEKWISGYYGKNIFLNRKKIEEKKIILSEFQNRITDFLVEFEGIQAAYSVQNLVNFSGESTDIRSKFRNSYHKNTSGDIVITLMPGWLEVDNKGRVVGDANSPQVFVPFYMLGQGIKAQTMFGDYSTTDIAPTISGILGIAAPNASVGNVIRF